MISQVTVNPNKLTSIIFNVSGTYHNVILTSIKSFFHIIILHSRCPIKSTILICSNNALVLTRFGQYRYISFLYNNYNIIIIILYVTCSEKRDH